MSKTTQGPAEPAPPAVPIPPELEGKALVPPSGSGQVVPSGAVAKAPPGQPETEAAKHEPGATSSFADRVHSYLWDNVTLADQKATFLFAGLAAALAYLHEEGITELADPRTWQLQDWLAFVAVAGVLVGATLALLVVLPRFRGAARGVVYWKAIASFKEARKYADHVSTLPPAELQEAVLRHCFELAIIARGKFRLFHLALCTGSVGLVATLLYLAIY